MRISLQIVERLHRLGFEELTLDLVQFSCIEQRTPFLVGQHLEPVVVHEAIRQVREIVATVAISALAQRANEIVLLVETIGIAERLVAGVDRIHVDAVA